jgi:hypothetical protein
MCPLEHIIVVDGLVALHRKGRAQIQVTTGS